MRVRHVPKFVILTLLVCVVFSVAHVTAEKKVIGLDGQVCSLDFSKSIPNQLNYQGFLVNASDSSVVTATLEMTFRLFDSETKGAELWAEIHPAVEVQGGLFQVLLGSVTPFPGGLFDAPELWLQTEVGAEVLAPRKPLVSVAYSQMAAEAEHAATADNATSADQADNAIQAQQSVRADTADWADDAEHAVHADTAAYSPSATAWTVSGDDVYRATGKVGIGKTNPQTELDVAGTIQATGFKMPTGASDSYVLTSDSSGSATWQAVSGGAGGDITAVTAGTGLSGGGTTGDVELQVEVPLALSGSVSGSGSVIEGTNTGSGNGLSGTSTSNYGVYGISTDGIGVLGECPDGAGVAGYSTTGYAGYFDGKGYFSGDVGIGTTSPSAKLDVQGNGYFSGDVGIGVETPAVKLDVNGDINADSLYRLAGSPILSANGMENLFVGIGAGENSSGSYTTYVGDSAGVHNEGAYNTFVGRNSGNQNISGSNNTFMGDGAGLENTEGEVNTFIGSGAGVKNQLGDQNVFVGTLAGAHNVSGNNNTLVGNEAGYENTGSFNTFLGDHAGYFSVLGQDNVFIGYLAGWDNRSGKHNTYLGSMAGRSNQGGDRNVFIGFKAGYYCEGDSNKLYIANGAEDSDVLIYGDFSTGNIGLGTLDPDTKLEVQGGPSDHALIKIDQRGTNKYAGLRLDRDDNEKWFVGMSNSNDNLTFRRAASSNDMVIDTTGKVGIGMQTPSYKLDVAGDINTTGEIRKNGTAYNHPDYVFEPDYELMSLEDLREYVSENQCLPGMPSAQQVRQEGVKLFEQNRLQVEKLEEAYLYILSLQENILVLKENILVLEERITELEGSQK